MNILNKIGWISNLSNKYIFMGIIILSITILVGINNYFFYSYMDVLNKREAKKLETVVNEELTFCSDNNINISFCTNNIVSIINTIYRYNTYIDQIDVKDFNGNTIWKRDNNNHDEVTLIDISIKLPSSVNSQKATMNIDPKWNTMYFLGSIFRSMTLSVTQFISEPDQVSIRKAWYRSRPAIAFTIFTILIYLLYRRREMAIEAEMRIHDIEKVESQKELLKLEAENMTQVEYISQLESKVNDVAQKIQHHDKVINPPLNTLKYDQFLELDPESIIFKCRKVAEKLVIQIYQKNIDYNDRIPFYKRIEALSKDGLIDSKIVGYINTIKAFGNLSAHPNVDSPIEFSKEDALMISNALVLLIEELEIRNLLVTECA